MSSRTEAMNGEVRQFNSAAEQKTEWHFLREIATMLLLLFFVLSPKAGIPEPDLVWYGEVRAVSAGANVRVTSGTLEWHIEPVAGGTPWVVTTRLTNINDQFSFVLRIPCETPEPNASPTAKTITFTSPATTYRRVSVTLDGEPLSFKAGPTEFSPTTTDRGRIERIDLVLGSVVQDTDGDGLGDSWELQYFGGLNANPGDDPDGDGMTNLQEYRSGTNPKDAQSLFAVEIDAQPGGIKLRWSSQPEKNYQILRSANVLGAPESYQVLKTGIAATPPVNEFFDDTVATGAHFFYLIQVLQ